MSKFKPRPAYYSAHALRDGTIWFAMQTPKPRKTRHSTPEIDADGIHNWYVDEEELDRLTEWAKALRHGAVANCLNTKRIVRQQVEPKLDELLRQVSELNDRLARLEERLCSTE